MADVSLTLDTKEYPLTVVNGTTLTLSLSGPQGPIGPAGPNTVSTSTTTSLNGYLYGNGTTVGGATAATSSATANTLVLRDGSGGSNFAAVGATAVTASVSIATTGASATISTAGANGSISTSGNYGNIYTAGTDASITTSGANALIGTSGSNSYIETTGEFANISTIGADAYIATSGENAFISTEGANAYIQSRSTFKLFNGTHTTTLSHSPTADRAIAFPNTSGTVALINPSTGTQTFSGAQIFDSTTRPTSSATTGTLVAASASSLITKGDGDSRYGAPIVRRITTAVSAFSTTRVNSAETLSVPAGTYEVRGFLAVLTASITAGAQAEIIPSNLTADYTAISSFRIVGNSLNGASGTPSSGVRVGNNLFQYAASAFVDGGVSGLASWSFFNGTVVFSAAQTITPTIRQRSTNDAVNAAILQPGSYIEFRPII
jgi:hypothetical protein